MQKEKELELSNFLFLDPGFINSINKLISVDLPVIIGYNLTKIIDELEIGRKRFEDFKLKLIKKYGKEEKDKSIKVEEKNMDKYLKELNQLLLINEKYSFSKLKISLEKIKEVKLNINDLKLLGNIIEFIE